MEKAWKSGGKSVSNRQCLAEFLQLLCACSQHLLSTDYMPAAVLSILVVLMNSHSKKIDTMYRRCSTSKEPGHTKVK